MFLAELMVCGILLILIMIVFTIIKDKIREDQRKKELEKKKEALKKQKELEELTQQKPAPRGRY